MNKFSSPQNILLRGCLRIQTAGFTLSELLIASVITSLVISLAGFGLISVLRANERSTDEQERHVELNRALSFMVDDIKEAKSVSIDPDPEYLFKVTKSGVGGNREIVYYTVPQSSAPRWRGPRILYRKEIAPNVKDAEALIDAIANVNPTCSGNGDVSGNQKKGLKAFVQNQAHVKLCLVGQLNDSKILLLESHAFARGFEPPTP